MKLAAHDPYAVVMCIICVRPTPRVPELGPFFKIPLHPYRENLFLKLLSQFSNHLNDIFFFFLISLDKAGVEGILTSISDSFTHIIS